MVFNIVLGKYLKTTVEASNQEMAKSNCEDTFPHLLSGPFHQDLDHIIIIYPQTSSMVGATKQSSHFPDTWLDINRGKPHM